jgi:hypothetical protein
MTPVNGDFDQMLRRALHAEVDLIEPSAGALERIRQRTHAPWLVRQTSLMLTDCVDLARLIGIRLEPRFTGVRATIAARGGLREAFVGLLSSVVSILAGAVAPSRRHGAAHRGWPGRPPHARARVGSNLAWLRPVVAVAGAVVIVVAGVYGLAQVRGNLVLELFRGGSAPASTGPGTSNGGRQGPALQGQSSPAGIIGPSGTTSGSARPSPTATCPAAQKQSARPSPAATCPSPSAQQATPTSTPTTGPPTPIVTPTTTPPTPVVTDTTEPAPTDSTEAD